MGMTYTKLWKIVHIEDKKYNRRVVCELLNILNAYGYMTEKISGESKITFESGCETTLYDGANTRYLKVNTDLRTLNDGHEYLHIGIELKLNKLLTFVDTVELKKHVLLDVEELDNRIETTLFEMVRELIF